MRISLLAVLSLSLLPALCIAQEQAKPGGPEYRTTAIKGAMPEREGVGAQYRTDYVEAMQVIARDKDLPRAQTMLERIATACDAFERPNLRMVAAQDRAQYDRYVAEHGDGTPVEWLDMACPWARKSLAYVIIERRGDTALALEQLDRAAKSAPFWPDARLERGFLFNVNGRAAEGLAEYTEALRMMEADGATATDRAMALRGMGYSHVELGDWKQARESYQRSLELDPGNDIATKELAFIAKHENAQAAE